MSYRGWAVICWALFYLSIAGIAVNLYSTVIALAAFVNAPTATHAAIPPIPVLCGAGCVVTAVLMKAMLGQIERDTEAEHTDQ